MAKKAENFKTKASFMRNFLALAGAIRAAEA